MATLDELRKRKAELIARNKRGSMMIKEDIEKKKLKQEIRELKYPKTVKATRTIGRVGVSTLKSFGRKTGEIVKKQYSIGAEQAKKEFEMKNRKPINRSKKNRRKR